MKRRFLAAVVALSFWGCPAGSGDDPYLLARTIIIQVQTASSFADGIFQQWLLTVPEEVREKKEAVYAKIKTSLFYGLQLALDGVDIAEQANRDPDIEKLLEKANVAWEDLQNFLVELLWEKGERDIPESDVSRVSPEILELRKLLELLPERLGR